MRKHAFRRGFTLIEVMTVCSIIAILAAVAIPELSARIRRAKRAESDIAMTKIEQQVKRYFDDKNRFPTSTGTGTSTLTASWNPAVLSYTSKFNPRQSGWLELEIPLDGVNRYFSYQLSGAHSSGTVTWTLTMRSDLDGDGLVALRTRTWTLSKNDWMLSSDVVSGDNEY
jgi:prepilin-type N-terminal cleavage/methylation domain-containing protein